MHKTTTSYGWGSLRFSEEITGSVVLYFMAAEALTLNMASRSKDVRFRVRACLKRYEPSALDEDEILRAHFKIFPRRLRISLLQELTCIIDEVSRAPLTPRMVCEALGITPQERTKLTRRGLLKSSGQANFLSGNGVGYYKLYSAYSVREIFLKSMVT